MKVKFPGFFDLQVNGFAGVDFNTPGLSREQIRQSAAAMLATGVTRFLPTLITSSFERFAACARNLRADWAPAIAGIHMEGPYLSAVDGARGAHPLEHIIPPSLEDFSRRQEAAGGMIVLVTLAPEADGALALIEGLVSRNIRVAIGHTMASRERIRDAISAGATLSTHLGNGCPPVLPRHDNVIWEQLAADELGASLIVDGHHLPPAVVKTMVRAKGEARTLLVTDATAAAGAPPGRYQLGEGRLQLAGDGRVTLPGGMGFAGSSLTMNAAVANTARFSGLPLERVLPMAGVQPARAVGLEPCGQVEGEWDAKEGRLEIGAVDPAGGRTA